jgi:hypothetical protein
MAHWFTHREQGFSVERAVVAEYDLSVMRVDDAAYWLVVRDGRDVAEGEAATPERARWCAETVDAVKDYGGHVRSSFTRRLLGLNSDRYVPFAVAFAGLHRHFHILAEGGQKFH